MMKFTEIGDQSRPVLLFFPAMFCNAEMFANILVYFNEYRIIIVTYDGHDNTDSVFTSIDDQINKTINYLEVKGIKRVDLVLGTSLGAILAFEIYRRQKIAIESAFLDGGPFFSWPSIVVYTMSKVFGFICKICKFAPKNPYKMVVRFKSKASYLGESNLNLTIWLVTQFAR